VVSAANPYGRNLGFLDIALNNYAARQVSSRYSIPVRKTSTALFFSCRALQRSRELKLKTKLRGLSPRANYSNRMTAACRRSLCQLLRLEGATWST
jgi:hypothetical protein